MVQPKVKPPETNWLDELLDRTEKENPIVATRFWIDEVTPSRKVSDEYDFYWSDEIRTKVSPFFETIEEAKDWESEHLPDKGKVLQIMKQHKRRTVTEKWWLAVGVK